MSLRHDLPKSTSNLFALKRKAIKVPSLILNKTTFTIQCRSVNFQNNISLLSFSMHTLMNTLSSRISFFKISVTDLALSRLNLIIKWDLNNFSRRLFTKEKLTILNKTIPSDRMRRKVRKTWSIRQFKLQSCLKVNLIQLACKKFSMWTQVSKKFE